MTYNVPKFVLVCIFILCLGGCLSVKHPYKKIDYYTLEYDSPPIFGMNRGVFYSIFIAIIGIYYIVSSIKNDKVAG